MKDNFVCSDSCLDCDERCAAYGGCYSCERLDSDLCENCYFFDEEKNLEFYEVRVKYDL